MERIITTTADGSKTLYVPDLDEHFHSIHGAVQESKHVFIQSGFQHIVSNHVHVFEVGFGTGLNALLTYIEAQKRECVVRYSSIEKFPLTEPEYRNIKYSSFLNLPDNSIFDKMHTAGCNEDIYLSNNFLFNKYIDDIRNFSFEPIQNFDLVYFDAFAPNKQPEMWTEEIFKKIYRNSNPGASLVTYCAKGDVRRMLMSVGYRVERIPGPPRKRHMLRALKI